MRLRRGCRMKADEGTTKRDSCCVAGVRAKDDVDAFVKRTLPPPVSAPTLHSADALPNPMCCRAREGGLPAHAGGRGAGVRVARRGGGRGRLRPTEQWPPAQPPPPPPFTKPDLPPYPGIQKSNGAPLAPR